MKKLNLLKLQITPLFQISTKNKVNGQPNDDVSTYTGLTPYLTLGMR